MSFRTYDSKNNSLDTVAAAHKITVPTDPVHLTVVGNKLFFSAGEAKVLKKGQENEESLPTSLLHARYLEAQQDSWLSFGQHTNQKHPMVDGAKLYFKIHEGLRAL